MSSISHFLLLSSCEHLHPLFSLWKPKTQSNTRLFSSRVSKPSYGFSTDFIRMRYSARDWMFQLSESVPRVCSTSTHKLLASKNYPLDPTSFSQGFLFALLLNPEV